MKRSSHPSLIVSIIAVLLTVFVTAQVTGHEQIATDGTGWHAPPEAANRSNPIQADSSSIERGKALFLELCTTCHGKEAKGDGPVAARLPVETPDLTDESSKHSAGELAWKISTGRSSMPKWGDKLSEKQIWDIVNFIQNL